MKKNALSLICLLTILFAPTTSHAGETTIAVAANFTDVTRQLAELFEQDTGHTIKVSFGSTGKLYAQIEHDAPFEVFLAADSKRPQLAEEKGLGVAGTRFTYASGRLVLWSPTPNLFENGKQYLADGNFRHLAIANPRTAPYGLAAQQMLTGLDLWQPLQGKLVRGESISQTFQFAATGNAEAGLVALSQVRGWKDQNGTTWEVPAHYHEPIHQQVILLKKGKDNPAARAWLEFLRSDQAVELIKSYGYDIE